MRAEKRLVKIRVKLREAGVRNREECKKMVSQDWKDALNLRLTDGENEDNIENIKFTFNFNVENIKNA
jgi:predicted secreted protein